jgi:hypothetical protein
LAEGEEAVTRCTRCRRPLKRPTETGMGDVCARKSKAVPVPAHERDLFGYEIEAAVKAARYRLAVYIAGKAAEAYIAVRDGFAQARRDRGVWA